MRLFVKITFYILMMFILSLNQPAQAEIVTIEVTGIV